jgi:hypothetical protein
LEALVDDIIDVNRRVDTRCIHQSFNGGDITVPTSLNKPMMEDNQCIQPMYTQGLTEMSHANWLNIREIKDEEQRHMPECQNDVPRFNTFREMVEGFLRFVFCISTKTKDVSHQRN